MPNCQHNHKVAWAILVDEVMENCKKQAGGIEEKTNSWNKVIGSAPRFPHHVGKDTKCKAIDVHSCHVVAFDTTRIGIYVAYLKELIKIRAPKLEKLKAILINVEGELQSKHESLLKTQGSSSGIDVVAAKLEKLKKKEQEIQVAFYVDLECLKDIATQMSMLSDALAML